MVRLLGAVRHVGAGGAIDRALFDSVLGYLRVRGYHFEEHEPIAAVRASSSALTRTEPGTLVALSRTMHLRIAWTWTLWTLALVLLSLAAATWTGARLFSKTVERGVAATQVALAEAAVASVEGELDGARNKLVAMGRLLAEERGNADGARALDRLIDPPDLFLEVGIWSDVWNLATQPRPLANSQQATFLNANTINAARQFDVVLGQNVEQIDPLDPRLSSARLGQPYTQSKVERIGGLASVSMSAPVAAGRVVLAAFDVERLADVVERFVNQPAHRIALYDGEGVLMAQSQEPFVDALRTTRAIEGVGWSVVVEDDRATALAPLRSAQRQILVALAALCAVCIVVAMALARRVVAPVRDLALAAERLGAGDLDTRSGIDRGDEIGDLARAFDQMADSLQELDRMKSDFAAHVSHELRTPLTSAVLTLANIEDGLADRTSLARVRVDLDRLVHMVEGLLDAARLAAGASLQRSNTPLSAIVHAAVDSLRPLARVPIVITGDGPPIELDRARMHQVVVNLVENALRHARTSVLVAIDGSRLTVSDDGPGVAEADRERIFDRFVRLDHNAPGLGAGLGLSIARAIVEQHGGTLFCTGSSFEVAL